MSLNDRKFARHIGIIAQKVDLPIIQLGIEAGKIAVGPLMGGRASPSRFTGYGFFYVIDPPAGGFANTDPVAQIPDTAAFQSIIATKTFDATNLFHPGHWMVCVNVGPPATVNLGYYIGFYEVDFNGQLYGMGGGSAPFIGAVTPGTTVPPQGFFQFPLYAPRPWQMRVFIFGAHSDTATGRISGVISPVHLLDDGPSAT